MKVGDLVTLDTSCDILKELHDPTVFPVGYVSGFITDEGSYMGYYPTVEWVTPLPSWDAVHGRGCLLRLNQDLEVENG